MGTGRQSPFSATQPSTWKSINLGHLVLSVDPATFCLVLLSWLQWVNSHFHSWDLSWLNCWLLHRKWSWSGSATYQIRDKIWGLLLSPPPLLTFLGNRNTKVQEQIYCGWKHQLDPTPISLLVLYMFLLRTETHWGLIQEFYRDTKTTMTGNSIKNSEGVLLFLNK